MVQAFKSKIVCPNKHASQNEVFYKVGLRLQSKSDAADNDDDDIAPCASSEVALIHLVSLLLQSKLVMLQLSYIGRHDLALHPDHCPCCINGHGNSAMHREKLKIVVQAM